jgi:hypothetical protein
MEFGASIFFTDYSITPAELAVSGRVASQRSDRARAGHIPLLRFH